MVAHCYGFAHDIKDGEALARRIAACLNFCRGMDTQLLEVLVRDGQRLAPGHHSRAAIDASDSL